MARPYLGGSSAGVEQIASATSLGIADSGKVFIVSQASAYDITLPTLAKGKGFSCRFILGTKGGNAVNVVGGTADKISGIEMGAGSGYNAAITADSDMVTFAATEAEVGDWIDVVCDGLNYYVIHGAENAAGATHSG